MERIRPEGSDPNQPEMIHWPTYTVNNIKDFLDSRDAILADAVENYERWMQEANALKGWERHLNRAFAPNPTSTWSVLGKFKQETTKAGVYIAMRTVRHDPTQDTSKKFNRITLHDPSGQLEVSLPDLWGQKLWELMGKRTFPEDTLKKHAWGSDVLLYCDINKVNGKYTDEYHLVGVNNRNIGGSGRGIPTVLTELRQAGFEFNPQSNS